MSSLKKLAIRGTIWTFFGYGASQSLRFASNLILTRLLVPEFFGLMALVNVFIMGLHLFSDIGIGPSIIQNKRGDEPAFFNTAWTMQVIRGFWLWFVCILVALPTAQFYGEPLLLWLIPIVGLTTAISGFNSTALFSLNRHVALGKVTMLELGVQVSGLAVMLVWAWFSPTIWALVSGGLVSSVLYMVWSHRLIPGLSNRFAWEQDAVKEIFAFGKWIFVSTALTFLAGQADKLILAKLISVGMLGVYNIAFTLADIPRQVIGKFGMAVVFPVISQQADLPREVLRAKIQKKRWPVLVGSALLLTVLVSFGDLVISVLYDKRYSEATWMMPLLALGLWHTLLYTISNAALLAIGKPLYGSWGYLLTFLNICIGVPLGYSLNGMLGAVLVLALSDLPMYCTVSYGLWRERMFCLGQDIKATILFLALIASVLFARFICGWGFPLNQLLQ